MASLKKIITKDFWTGIFGWMRRVLNSKKTWQYTGIIVLTLVILFFEVYLWVDYSAESAIEKELEEIRQSGAPVELTDLYPPDIPADENAATIYLQVYDLLTEEREEELDDVDFGDFAFFARNWLLGAE